MAYYEPADLSIFALVTREIQVHELKLTGVKHKFTHIQSLRVESIVECMSIATHKVSGNLLICLGTQGARTDESEIVIFELDPKNEWEVFDSYRWVWRPENPQPEARQGGPAAHRNRAKAETPGITNILYKNGCGLVVTSFSGYIEIYDSVNTQLSVWNNRQRWTSKILRECGSISAIDFSEEQDLLAFGGVSGVIHFIDQTTKKHNGLIKAHHNQEIIMLKFYDEQHQLISVTLTGDVGLWDSQKMIKYQVLKNSPNMLQKFISSCTFYKPLGKIMLATTKVFNYQLCTDNNVQI